MGVFNILVPKYHPQDCAVAEEHRRKNLDRWYHLNAKPLGPSAVCFLIITRCMDFAQRELKYIKACLGDKVSGQ